MRTAREQRDYEAGMAAFWHGCAYRTDEAPSWQVGWLFAKSCYDDAEEPLEGVLDRAERIAIMRKQRRGRK